VDVPASHRSPAAALLATLLACNPPPAADTSDATAITTTPGSDATDGPPPTTSLTSTPTTGTASASVTGTTGACEDGSVLCPTPETRQVCDGGAWVDAPCAAGEGCLPDDGVCRPCTCEPGATQGCVDAGTIETCGCFGFAPSPCPDDTACADLDGDVACHTIVCNPGESECDGGEAAHACNASGTAWVDQACAAGDLCDPGSGKCMDACAVVAKTDSSLGCEFWGVDMPNVPPRHNFVYAVALSNPSSTSAADIAIYDRNNLGNEQMIASGTIAPRAVEIFPLSGTSNGDVGHYPTDAGFNGTGIAKGRAFRITSDAPIVATQFNPLGGAQAYTTDASLLLPTHTLANAYYHLAWDKGSGAGSTLVVIATEDNTVVTVTSPVDTVAGTNGMPALQAGVAKALPALKRYDYVQISAADQQDLSTAKITANAEVAVFGGHSCGHVPDLSVGNCDHLEEQIFPINTWGGHYVAARPPARASEPTMWRVLAAKDGTVVTFNPPVSIGPSAELDAGELVQFTSTGDFEVGTNQEHPVLVAGYFYGCESAQQGQSCPGDPSMALVVPAAQWLRDYVFLVDFSYANDSVKLIRPTGQSVALDCLGPVTDWKAVTPAYESAVVKFNAGSCKPGTNIATGSAPFGIMVVGEAESTSYAYPGGLQLKPINPQ